MEARQWILMVIGGSRQKQRRPSIFAQSVPVNRHLETRQRFEDLRH